MPQEALKPGTDAITRGQIECVPYRGGWLVRYRNLNGYTAHRQFDDPELAHQYMLECMGKLRAVVAFRSEIRYVSYIEWLFYMTWPQALPIQRLRKLSLAALIRLAESALSPRCSQGRSGPKGNRDRRPSNGKARPERQGRGRAGGLSFMICGCREAT